MTLPNPTSCDALTVRIDAILPQTQCSQCGYPGCKPYAAAIADGKADINQCPPGGDAGARALSELLNVEYKPLNIAYGLPKPKAIASIDESICIGCTLCLQACPVDAILGAARHMHTVIAQECTGCELCIAPCPVDCISMETIAHDAVPASGDIKKAADIARSRHEFHQLRIARERRERAQQRAQKIATAKAAASSGEMSPAEAAKKAAIAAAIERVRMQKASVQALNGLNAWRNDAVAKIGTAQETAAAPDAESIAEK